MSLVLTVVMAAAARYNQTATRSLPPAETCDLRGSRVCGLSVLYRCARPNKVKRSSSSDKEKRVLTDWLASGNFCRSGGSQSFLAIGIGRRLDVVSLVYVPYL